MLRCYAAERRRHPDLFKEQATPREVTKALRYLINRFRVPVREVRYLKSEDASFWCPQDRVLSLSVDYLDWLEVAHEFAHALHDATRGQTYHHHPRTHAALTDQIASIIRGKKWHLGRLNFP